MRFQLVCLPLDFFSGRVFKRVKTSQNGAAGVESSSAKYGAQCTECEIEIFAQQETHGTTDGSEEEEERRKKPIHEERK